MLYFLWYAHWAGASLLAHEVSLGLVVVCLSFHELHFDDVLLDHDGQFPLAVFVNGSSW